MFTIPTLHFKIALRISTELDAKEQNCIHLALLPGTVSILHGSLLNHMMIITKVGVSYVDDINDDVLEVDSISCGSFLLLFY